MRTTKKRPKKTPPKHNEHENLPSVKSYRWLLLIIPISLAIAAGVYLQAGFMLYLSTLATFVFTFSTVYITQNQHSRPVMKYLVPALVAVIPSLVSGVVEKYNEINSKPIFTIKTKTEDDIVNISLKSLKGKISGFSIDYPTLGVIEDIRNLNSVTDVKTTKIRATYSPKRDVFLLANAEIAMEDITEDTSIEYRILYKSVVPIETFITDRDRYKVTYTWMHKGIEHSKTEWYLVKNDQLTGKSSMTIQDVRFWNRAITEEEIKQDYEEFRKGLLHNKKTFD